MEMRWKLVGRSSLLQEVLIVTMSERKFKGGRNWLWQRQHSIIISEFFPRKTKSTPRLNAVEVKEEIRAFIFARGFDRHDQWKEVQRRRNLAKAKATFNHHLTFFFWEKQNLIFLWCGSCYAPCFFPNTTLFSQDFAPSVLCVVVFKTSMPCWECCRRVIWRLILPDHKGWMLQVCVGNPFVFSLLTALPWKFLS